MADMLLVPTPYEEIRLPADLDGSTGRNRATGKTAQIAAVNDLQAIPSDNFATATTHPGVCGSTPAPSLLRRIQQEFRERRATDFGDLRQ